MVFRYTSHDSILRIKEEDGLSYDYSPAGKLELTATESTLGLAVSNFQFTAFVDDDALLDDELKKGVFKSAKIQVYLAYWKNSRVAALPLKQGWVGEIVQDNNSYRTDIRGIAQLLAQKFIDSTSIDCRYIFGDQNTCRISLVDRQIDATVTAVTSDSEFVIDDFDGKDFKYGEVLFLTGDNEDIAIEVAQQDETTIQLFLPTPNQIAVGDTLRLTVGCDKTYISCKAFNNTPNFGGEPFLETTDSLTRYIQ